MKKLILILAYTISFSASATTEVTAPKARPLPTSAESAQLDRALETFRRGDELPDPILRAQGLNDVIKLSIVLERRGVVLRFNPLKMSDEQVARELRSLERIAPIASGRGIVRKMLSTCFMVANLACGLVNSSAEITEVEELPRPAKIRAEMAFDPAFATQ